MKKQRAFCVFLAVCTALWAAGCAVSMAESPTAAQETLSPASSAANDAACEEESIKPEPVNLRLLTAQKGIVYTIGGETAAGCYSLDPYTDGTADIIYYDYQSGTCSRLSDDPALGHDPRSTAYIPATQGGARCFVSGDRLYVIKSGQPYTDPSIPGNDPMARLYCMELDGSGRTVQELGSDLVFHWYGGMAGDDAGSLYTVVSLVDMQSKDIRCALIRMRYDLEGYEILRQWDSEIVDLVGVCGDGFLLCEAEQTAETLHKRLFRVEMQTGEETSVAEWTDGAVTSYTAHEGILYYTKLKDAHVYRLRLADGTELPSCAIFAPDRDGERITPAALLIACEVRGGRLFLQMLHPDWERSRYAALDLETGEQSALSLYAGEGEAQTFMGVYAEGKECFMLLNGELTRSRQSVGIDGQTYTFEQKFENFVLISQEDYWDNQPNYREFTYYND